MNVLKVPYLKSSYLNDPDFNLSEVLSSYKPSKLLFAPWKKNEEMPEVLFFIAYGDDALFLKFVVKEKYFRAKYTKTNDLVYNDSCVEFFIGFDETTYYNFEFNALGTAYAAYGLADKRELLPESLINNIKIDTGNKTVKDDALHFHWELTLTIPFTLFYKHSMVSLKGVDCRANFYKCGDELPEPHFLCWNNVVADQPKFHVPEYFGKLIFDASS